MQMGLNTDLQRQGKTLHVQTEDVNNSEYYVITHLFLAGDIIASERQEYEENLSAEEVKTLIRTQHQKMMQAVLTGHYDRTLLLSRPRTSSLGLRPKPKKKLTLSSHPLTHQSSQEALVDPVKDPVKDSINFRSESDVKDEGSS